jgi:hypothetical protein
MALVLGWSFVETTGHQKVDVDGRRRHRASEKQKRAGMTQERLRLRAERRVLWGPVSTTTEHHIP